MFPLAEIDPTQIGLIVNGLTSLLTLGFMASRFVKESNGKGSERQIEPTTIAALTKKIDDLSETISDGNRESGSISTALESLAESVKELRDIQRGDIAGAHRRIDDLSKDVSRHSAQIDGIQRACAKC